MAADDGPIGFDGEVSKVERDLRLDLPQWNEFEAEAEQHDQNPVTLLNEYIREYLEVRADNELDREISAEAQASGYDETDAVELVRQMRRERMERGAAA